MTDPTGSLLAPSHSAVLWMGGRSRAVYSTAYQFCKLYTFCLKSELVSHVLWLPTPPPPRPIPNTSSATLSRLTAITNTASRDVTQLYLPTTASGPKLLHSAVLLSCRHFHTCTTDPNLLPSSVVSKLVSLIPFIPSFTFLFQFHLSYSSIRSKCLRPHPYTKGVRGYPGHTNTGNTLRRVRVTNVVVEKQYYI